MSFKILVLKLGLSLYPKSKKQQREKGEEKENTKYELQVTLLLRIAQNYSYLDE